MDDSHIGLPIDLQPTKAAWVYMQLHPWLMCCTQKLQLSGGAHVHAMWDVPFICCTPEEQPRCCGVCGQAEKSTCIEGCHAQQKGGITVTQAGRCLQVVSEGLSTLWAMSVGMLTQNST